MPSPIPILYEDNHLLVCVKPPNMLSQSDDTGDPDMLTLLKKYIKEKYDKPGEVYLGLVHRLDRPAGGVMVFARTSKAASRLSEQFSSHAQGRNYVAVLQGTLGLPQKLENYLVKGSDGFVREAGQNDPGARYACLTTTPLAAVNGLTLTDVELFTGRAHQIRVQHALIGHPLWGDARYGSGKPGQQLALWAYRLSFTHPTKKEPVTFTCPPPDSGIWKDFEADLSRLVPSGT